MNGTILAEGINARDRAVYEVTLRFPEMLEERLCKLERMVEAMARAMDQQHRVHTGDTQHADACAQ